jgi:membrane-bound serine protease (ClpP class)
MLLLLVVIIITAAFLIMVRSGRRGWLSRTSLFETGTVHADADGMTDGTPNYNFLFNVECKTVTSLRTSGKIIYENKYYDVVTQGDFIDANTLVRVVEVEGARIVVEKV